MPDSPSAHRMAEYPSAVMTHPDLDDDIVQHNDLIVVRGYESLVSEHRLDSLDALFELRSAESLDKPGLPSWRRRLRLDLATGSGPRTLYLKRFLHPPWEARRDVCWIGTGARSLAELEWTWMRRLAGDDVPCARPIVYGHELHRRHEVRSALLMEEVPGRSLESWATDWTPADHERIRLLLQPLAAIVSRLHGAGYVHRDLYLSHVFYEPSRPLEASLHLIDLHRVMRPRLNRRRWIIKDLASLDFSTPRRLVTRADRVRWLKQYLGIRKLDEGARRLLYRVMVKNGKIARHERRRRARQATGSTQS